MNTPKWILLAEDDSNDARLTLHALIQTSSPVTVVHVKDGAEALNCLYRRDVFASRDTGPPALLLLDLKMPRVDGFAVLKQIKSDRDMKAVPVTVFTSSREPADVARSYELGTNAYVVKPVDFQALLKVLQGIKNFWINYNERPTERAPGRIGATDYRGAQATPDSSRQAIEE